jgi:hypothetical protein
LNFPGIVRVDLTRIGQVRYDVTQANRLWLAKVAAVAGVVYTNPYGDVGHTPILGIRIDDQNNDQIPWALFDGYMNSFSGVFSKLYVTVLANPASAAQMILNTGNDVAGAYCNYDGLSPTVGAGALGSLASPSGRY